MGSKFQLTFHQVGDGRISPLPAPKAYTQRLAPENPWERQPRETAQAYEAFCLYRDMGPARTAAAVAKDLGKDKRMIYKWSGFWDWQERARKWDQNNDRLAAEEHAAEMKRMAARQAKLGAKMQEVAQRRVEQYLDSPELMETLSASETVKLASEGAKLERAAVGADTTDGAKGPAVVLVFEGNAPRWANPKQDAPRDFKVIDGEARLLPANVPSVPNEGDGGANAS